MKKIIGLTGPTGSGKSSLTVVCKEKGYTVINCDLVARAAVVKGSDGLNALIKVFGDDILLSDGTLNRKELAKKAFATRKNTQLLNSTLLPYISKLIYTQIENCDKVILDAPTLFESGIDEICTKTIAVLADKKTRLSRIISRDGIDEQSALLRINAGKTDDFYRENADIVLYNNGELQNLIDDFKKEI